MERQMIRGRMRFRWQVWTLGLLATTSVNAQELEPRAYSPAPVGVNFLIGSYSRSSGEVLLDPSIPVTNVSAKVQVSSIGYARTFGLFGRSSSAGLVLPYVAGSLSGDVGEQRATVDRSGIGDARFRFVINLIGGPALTPKEFAAREPGTALGMSLNVVAPTGEYDPAKLINIGANRWSFKPDIGVTHEFGPWFVEGSAGVWLFTDNTNFYGGNTKQQDPLYTYQLHGGYTFRPGLWLSADATYYTGGRTSVNGVYKDDEQANSRYGVTLSLPISREWSTKLSWSNGLAVRIAGDFTVWSIALQYRWFDR
jgi:hypothetical protein